MVSTKHAYATDSAVRRAAGGGRRALTARPGPFGWIGQAVVRHPWRVIALWIVAAVAVIATAMRPRPPRSHTQSLAGSGRWRGAC